MLQCPRTKAYPLVLTAATCDDVEVEFSETFIRRMLPRINWPVFRDAASQLPDPDTISKLPEAAPELDTELDDSVLRAIHRALLEWHVVDGFMQAEDSATRYLVRNGIPNLVITEVVQKGGDPMHMDKEEEGEDVMEEEESGQKEGKQNP